MWNVLETYSLFAHRKDELSIMDDCIQWGSRVVIPLIKDLHEAHPGITCMNSLARGYMWWPGMDSDVEADVKKCHICQTLRNSPLQAPGSGHHIDVDYAGPICDNHRCAHIKIMNLKIHY